MVTRESKEFKEWLNFCQQMVDMNMDSYMPFQKKELKVDKRGRRYIKIIAVLLVQREDGSYAVNSNSAWAFIDSTNGDILKPASWKVPAKHARGNLFDRQKGTGMITPYVPDYLR